MSSGNALHIRSAVNRGRSSFSFIGMYGARMVKSMPSSQFIVVINANSSSWLSELGLHSDGMLLPLGLCVCMVLRVENNGYLLFKRFTTISWTNQ